MILIDMVNVIFLLLASVFEFFGVAASLVTKVLGDISSFFWGCSHALDAYNNGSNDYEDGGE